MLEVRYKKVGNAYLVKVPGFQDSLLYLDSVDAVKANIEAITNQPVLMVEVENF